MNKLAKFFWISCSLIMISILSNAEESELAKLKNGFTKKVNSVLLPLVQRHKGALLNLEKSLANISEVEQALLVREERLRISELELIDLIGYRSSGHIESDDTSSTQPEMYKKIKQHPSVLKSYR